MGEADIKQVNTQLQNFQIVKSELLRWGRTPSLSVDGSAE